MTLAQSENLTSASTIWLQDPCLASSTLAACHAKDHGMQQWKWKLYIYIWSFIIPLR